MAGFRSKVEVQYIVMPGKTNQVDAAVKAIAQKISDNNKIDEDIKSLINVLDNSEL